MEKVEGPDLGACWPLIIPHPTFFTLLDWKAHVFCVYEPRWPNVLWRKALCPVLASCPHYPVLGWSLPPSWSLTYLQKKDISCPLHSVGSLWFKPHSAEVWDEPSDILEINWGALSARTLHLRTCEEAHPCGRVRKASQCGRKWSQFPSLRYWSLYGSRVTKALSMPHALLDHILTIYSHGVHCTLSLWNSTHGTLKLL